MTNCEKQLTRDEIAEQKALLRKQLRGMRRALSPEQVENASLVLCARVCALPAFQSAKLILSYVPAKNEIDVRYINSVASASGKRVAYPLCVEDGGLRLFVPRGENAMRPGAYGIPEPDMELSDEVFPDELDLIIVPAVGFTAQRRRLGQGGGYYDRLLARTDAVTVGVGYDFQLVEELPVEPHDKTLDICVTPSAVY